MIKRNLTFTQFADFMNSVATQYKGYETAALTFIGEMLTHEAKDYIGHLQTGGILYPDWKELAESTKRDKERKGYVLNQDYNPLYRTGQLRDSISYFVGNNTITIGSTSEIMVYQEMGTMHIPPRPVIGLVMYKNRINIETVLGDFLLFWMTRQTPLFKRKVK